MASRLSGILDGYRTLLTAAGFTLLNENQEPYDNAGSSHQKYKLIMISTPDLRDMYGGGAEAEYEVDLQLEYWADPESRESTVWNGIADDLMSMLLVMLKPGNRPTGCQKLQTTGKGPIEKRNSKQVHAELYFRCIFRELHVMV